MDIKELNKNIESFINSKIEYIQNYLTTNKYIIDDFFSNIFTFYGKEYLEDTGFKENIDFKKLRGMSGIYIFFMDEDLSLDIKEVSKFNNIQGAKFKSYSAQDLKKGDCIYVGSSTGKRGSLFQRINQHFKDSNCFWSLKLNNQDRKILKDKIKIVAFPIINNEELLKVIVKMIELKLHDILLPTNGNNL